MSTSSLRRHFTNKSVTGAPYSIKSYSLSHSWTLWWRVRWQKQCRLEVAAELQQRWRRTNIQRKSVPRSSSSYREGSITHRGASCGRYDQRHKQEVSAVPSETIPQTRGATPPPRVVHNGGRIEWRTGGGCRYRHIFAFTRKSCLKRRIAQIAACKQTAMTSQSYGTSDAPVEITVSNFLVASVCTICAHGDASFCQITLTSSCYWYVARAAAGTSGRTVATTGRRSTWSRAARRRRRWAFTASSRTPPTSSWCCRATGSATVSSAPHSPPPPKVSCWTGLRRCVLSFCCSFSSQCTEEMIK